MTKKDNPTITPKQAAAGIARALRVNPCASHGVGGTRGIVKRVTFEVEHTLSEPITDEQWEKLLNEAMREYGV